MTIVNVIAGPLVGSVIGYFTNYIAVRMLFRPLNPVKIGEFTLPFTPGMIPKRKSDLAKALGRAVGENLFTQKDVKELLKNDSIENKVVEGISAWLETILEQSVADIGLEYVGEEVYEEKKEQLENLLCDRIKEGILELDLTTLIASCGGAALKDKFQGGMLAMFITDDLIASVAGPIAEQLKDYVEVHGQEMFTPLVDKQVTELSIQPIGNLIDTFGIDLTSLKNKIRQLYETLIEDNIDAILMDFDIAGTVRQKVDEMDVLELEHLVLSVMKKELDGIVRLGAVIGFVIGILNIFL